MEGNETDAKKIQMAASVCMQRIRSIEYIDYNILKRIPLFKNKQMKQKNPGNFHFSYTRFFKNNIVEYFKPENLHNRHPLHKLKTGKVIRRLQTTNSSKGFQEVPQGLFFSSSTVTDIHRVLQLLGQLRNSIEFGENQWAVQDLVRPLQAPDNTRAICQGP